MISPSFQEVLERIRNDTSSGAAEIAYQVLDAMQAEGIESSSLSRQEHLQHLLDCAKLLLETHPEMAVLDSVLREFLTGVKNQFSKGEGMIDQLEAIQAVNRSLLRDLRQRENQAAANLASYLENYEVIMTLSWSSTVYHSFIKIMQNSGVQAKKIIVAESRPLLEGQALAVKLAKLGYRVELIIDAAIGRYISKAEIAVCGADSVLADGSILNKVGTYPLALSCADQPKAIPFVIAATTTKFSYRSLKENYSPVIREKPPEEILEDWETKGIIPRNEYFEFVSAELISVLITEQGIITSEIGEKVKQTLQKRFFSPLEWDD
ncbi:MAG: translation initiation factor eIF-2B [Candidatus Hodarchaeota archaeon]